MPTPLSQHLNMVKYSTYVGIFYHSGEPISPHLLCCGPFAVVNHSFMNRASHLQQPRLVNNPRELGIFLNFCLIFYTLKYFEFSMT